MPSKVDAQSEQPEVIQEPSGRQKQTPACYQRGLEPRHVAVGGALLILLCAGAGGLAGYLVTTHMRHWDTGEAAEKQGNSMGLRVLARFKQLETQLASVNSSMKEEAENLRSSMESMQARHRRLEANQADLNESLTGLTMNVSFLAVDSVDTTKTVSSYGTVQFPTIRHNYAPAGFGFSNSTGKFRCPFAGVYVFYFVATIHTTNGVYEFAIIKDTTPLSGIFDHNHNHDAISVVAVTPCESGEYVYVKNMQSSSKVLTTMSYGDPHFTGYMIRHT